MKQRTIICWIALAALILACTGFAAGEGETAMDDRSEASGIPDRGKLMDITIQIGGRRYDAILYDNAAGRFMAEQLPYTVFMTKGEIDYCGATALEFEGRGFDTQEGHVRGELLYDSGWYVLFLNEKLPIGESGPRIPFGRLVDESAADDLLENGDDAADVRIEAADHASQREGGHKLRMKIGMTDVAVAWERNESVEALKELCQDRPLPIRMSMYGGFEQVGPIGQRLPSQDRQTTTSAGDIVLYSSSQMVVFYGSNSWAYTRLGHIVDKSPEELRELLGQGDVTITVSVE